MNYTNTGCAQCWYNHCGQCSYGYQCYGQGTYGIIDGRLFSFPLGGEPSITYNTLAYKEDEQ